jgi:hypothetical protein
VKIIRQNQTHTEGGAKKLATLASKLEGFLRNGKSRSLPRLLLASIRNRILAAAIRVAEAST